jgi:hypothetical protein
VDSPSEAPSHLRSPVGFLPSLMKVIISADVFIHLLKQLLQSPWRLSSKILGSRSWEKPLDHGLNDNFIGHCRRLCSLSAFRTRGSLDRRVNCRRVPQPRWVGARRSAKGGRSRRETGVRGETCGLRVCPAPRSGALAVGGYKRPRGRERAAMRERCPVLPRVANPL